MPTPSVTTAQRLRRNPRKSVITAAKQPTFEGYRGGRTRTCNPRFWRAADHGSTMHFALAAPHSAPQRTGLRGKASAAHALVVGYRRSTDVPMRRSMLLHL